MSIPGYGENIDVSQLQHEPIAMYGAGGTRKLFRAAANAFDVNLSDEDWKNWDGLLSGALIVDHLLDVERLETVDPIIDIFEGNIRDDLDHSHQTAINELWLEQTPENAQAMLSKIERIGELVSTHRATTDPHELVSVRLDEATIFAELLALKASRTSDAEDRLRFNNWLFGWSRVGYLFDSMVDLAKDFANGEISVRPTITARTTIGFALSREATRAIKKTPPSLMSECAMNGVRYVLLNLKQSATQEGVAGVEAKPIVSTQSDPVKV